LLWSCLRKMGQVCEAIYPCSYCEFVGYTLEDSAL
jgi:hypothetical protein